jgi:hypothetical protein
MHTKSEVNIAFKDINHRKHQKFKSLAVVVVFLLGQLKNYVLKLPFLTTFKAQVLPFDDGAYNPNNMNKCFPFAFSWKKLTCLLELHVKNMITIPLKMKMLLSSK